MNTAQTSAPRTGWDTTVLIVTGIWIALTALSIFVAASTAEAVTNIFIVIAYGIGIKGVLDHDDETSRTLGLPILADFVSSLREGYGVPFAIFSAVLVAVPVILNEIRIDKNTKSQAQRATLRVESAPPRICPSCRAGLATGAQFCSACGANTIQHPVTPPPQPTANTQTSPTAVRAIVISPDGTIMRASPELNSAEVAQFAVGTSIVMIGSATSDNDGWQQAVDPTSGTIGFVQSGALAIPVR